MFFKQKALKILISCRATVRNKNSKIILKLTYSIDSVEKVETSLLSRLWDFFFDGLGDCFNFVSFPEVIVSEIA